jgi:hypothetical protein
MQNAELRFAAREISPFFFCLCPFIYINNKNEGIFQGIDRPICASIRNFEKILGKFARKSRIFIVKIRKCGQNSVKVHKNATFNLAFDKSALEKFFKKY